MQDVRWGGWGDLGSWKKIARLAQRGDADPISHYVALGGRSAGTLGSLRGAGAGGGRHQHCCYSCEWGSGGSATLILTEGASGPPHDTWKQRCEATLIYCIRFTLVCTFASLLHEAQNTHKKKRCKSISFWFLVCPKYPSTVPKPCVLPI